MFLGGAVSLGVGDGVEKSGVFLGGVVFIHDSRLDEVRHSPSQQCQGEATKLRLPRPASIRIG
jgi:hypothetical protein